jgi:hypothetical protein
LRRRLQLVAVLCIAVVAPHKRFRSCDPRFVTPTAALKSRNANSLPEHGLRPKLCDTCSPTGPTTILWGDGIAVVDAPDAAGSLTCVLFGAARILGC